MKTGISFVGCLAAALLVSAAAGAQDKDEGTPAAPPTPDEVTTGEVRVALSSDYAKLKMDGEAWEEHEFLNNGLLVVIHGVNRTAAHTVTLTPVYGDLAPVELTIKPEDWKLATVGKNEKMWRVERKVVFPKAPSKPAAKPEPKPAGDEPETP